MPLTKSQKRQLAVYLKLRDQPLSVLGLVWFNRRAYAAFFAIALVSGIIAYWGFCGLGAAFVGVAYGAMFFRDLGYYRRAKHTWPVLCEVLAWDKVQQLSQQSSEA